MRYCSCQAEAEAEAFRAGRACRSSSFVDPICGFCLSFHRTSPYGTHAQSSALGARSLIASLSRLDRDDAAALLNKLKWIRLDTLGTVKAGMAEYGRDSELQGVRT